MVLNKGWSLKSAEFREKNKIIDSGNP